MSIHTVRIGFSLAFVFALAAGCLSETKATDYHAAGTDGWFEVGYGYEGGKAVRFDESGIAIHANDEKNTGSVHAGGMLSGKHWFVDFDLFEEAAGKPFQDGGVAANLDEHGDSGVGDASIPRVHLDMAGWGEAAVTVDGKPQADPITGEDLWLAHYMVITTGVRDNDTHGIWNKNKTGPYDPSNAEDGYAEPNDLEIHLVLKSHSTTTPNATSVSVPTQTFTSPSVMTRSHNIYENKHYGTQANLSVHLTSDAPVAVRETDFKILDPSGVDIWSTSASASGGGMSNTVVPTFSMDKLGMYTLQVTAQGASIEYSLDGTVKPPANVIMNFWWETILMGADAEAFESTFAAEQAH